MEQGRPAHGPDGHPAHPGRRGRGRGAGPGAGPLRDRGRVLQPRAARRPDRPLAGLKDLQEDPDLWEWDYGGYEGLTTPQIQKDRPGWNLWRDGVIPGDAAHPGESVQQVGRRADRVLARARPLLAGGDVALVAHGHLLRVLTARWLAQDPSGGRLFRLDTGTVSTLGYEHADPVLVTWNVPPGR